MYRVYIALLMMGFAFAVLSDDLIGDGRIYNGYPATRGQIPYQAKCLMKKVSGGIFLCGGSLISPSWVVTASHCLVNTVSVKIFLGLVDGRNLSGVLTYNVDSSGIYQNPAYNATFQINDVSLYKLPSAVPLSDYPYISVIRLPKRSQAVSFFDNFDGIASGWGFLNDSGEMPNILQYTPARVMRHADCKFFYERRGVPLTDEMVCTNRTIYTAGTCQGDSGGPLAVNDTDGILTLIGTTSWGTSCTGKAPDVYGFVGKSLDWISQTTGISIRD